MESNERKNTNNIRFLVAISFSFFIKRNSKAILKIRSRVPVLKKYGNFLANFAINFSKI